MIRYYSNMLIRSGTQWPPTTKFGSRDATTRVTRYKCTTTKAQQSWRAAPDTAVRSEGCALKEKQEKNGALRGTLLGAPARTSHNVAGVFQLQDRYDEALAISAMCLVSSIHIQLL